MKILYVLPSLKKQAPIKIALTLAQGMHSSGHSVTILYFDDGIECDIPVGIVVEQVKFKSKYDLSKFDIVHSHMFRPDLYVFLNRIFKTSKTISTLHNYSYQELKSYYGTFYSLVFGSLWNLSWLNFDSLITLTVDGKKYYKKYSLNKAVKHIYNGHDLSVDYESFDLEITREIRYLKQRGYNIIGTYCNLTKRKRVDWLIKSLCDNSENALVLIGDGSEKDTLKTLASESGVNERVVFIDARPDAHQFNYFFDVFCIPSLHEGFGLALIEAALHKKNIVCSDIPTFRELFSEKEVFFFESHCQKSLNEAIFEALNSNKGEAACLKARSLYSEEAMIQNYYLEYERLVDE
ncbi:glycosyltransferase family 4 protein [Vibrio splendidus]